MAYSIKQIEKKRRTRQFRFIDNKRAMVKAALEKNGIEEAEIRRTLHFMHMYLKEGFKEGLKTADTYPKDGTQVIHWIDVKDELPAFGQVVLVHRVYEDEAKIDDYALGYRTCMEMGFKDSHQFIILASGVEVAHWMPIPEV